jgi:hypothetical protein
MDEELLNQMKAMHELFRTNFESYQAMMTQLKQRDEERHQAVMEELEQMAATRELMTEYLSKTDEQVDKLVSVTAAQIKLRDLDQEEAEEEQDGE